MHGPRAGRAPQARFPASDRLLWDGRAIAAERPRSGAGSRGAALARHQARVITRLIADARHRGGDRLRLRRRLPESATNAQPSRRLPPSTCSAIRPPPAAPRSRTGRGSCRTSRRRPRRRGLPATPQGGVARRDRPSVRGRGGRRHHAGAGRPCDGAAVLIAVARCRLARRLVGACAGPRRRATWVAATTSPPSAGRLARRSARQRPDRVTRYRRAACPPRAAPGRGLTFACRRREPTTGSKPMVELTLPKNSRVTTGKTWPRPEGAKNVRTFRIYRWDPGQRREPARSTPTSSTWTRAGRWSWTR